MSLMKIHNVETGEIVEREMNEQELVQWEAIRSAMNAEANAVAQAAAAKTALLERLGITEEEAKLLVS